MPLKKGSYKTISSNIKTEMKSGQATEASSRYTTEKGRQEQQEAGKEV
jgi:hypothetical protein